MDKIATIKSIHLYKLKIPLKQPFIISLGPIYDAESVVVRIETENGLVGWGENSPFLTINGESVDTGIVVGKLFIPFLIGKNALDIADCVHVMDNIIYGNNSIKSAFDIALHDIAAQQNKLPLYMYLGGAIQKEIQTDYTVSLNTPELMAQQAIEIRDQGFEVIKVKLGKNGKEDVKRIEAIRAAIGNDIPLRIDANQGWQVHEAIETLYALGKYNIQHAEEPIARWNYMHLPSIKLVSPIPIMCDESCYDINDLERLILLKACHKINIKLGKCGGLYKAMQMIKLAEKHNIPIQIGAFLESRLAMTAFVHLAHTNSMIQYFDFDTSLMFKTDPVDGGIIYKERGIIDLPNSIGLGASPKIECLDLAS
ncbi:MAG: dipeptide epimerase [Chitinophagaceae bacterium]|nr:MAG: dipeptide epimerase [Chitinophagaceae bacterium]